MAAIVVSSITNNWLPLAKSAPQRISMAVWPTGGNAGDGLKAQQILLGQPDFIVFGTTDTNTTGTALDLTAQGVTFPDGTQRILRATARCADASGQGVVSTIAVIDGGTTPLIEDESIDVTLDDGLAGAPTISFDMSGNSVLCVAVGVTDVDLRWVIEVEVGDAIPLAYIPTT